MRQNRVHLMPPMSNFYARICVKATPSSNKRSRMIRGWTDECRRYVTSMQELRTRTMQEALNAGKRQEARIIEQRVEKDATNDRMVEKAKAVKRHKN